MELSRVPASFDDRFGQRSEMVTFFFGFLSLNPFNSEMKLLVVKNFVILIFVFLV